MPQLLKSFIEIAEFSTGVNRRRSFIVPIGAGGVYGGLDLE
jgi:hypothetical protein